MEQQDNKRFRTRGFDKEKENPKTIEVSKEVSRKKPQVVIIERMLNVNQNNSFGWMFLAGAAGAATTILLVKAGEGLKKLKNKVFGKKADKENKGER